jgi:hypothetical protein
MSHPTKIMVIRHAEKPAASGSPHGVSPNGKEDPESLTVQGWQRAGALAVLFAPTHGALQNTGLAVPQVLFASQVTKHSSSERPQQTITPLCDKLGLKINTDYAKDDWSAMVNEALKSEGVVLICWEHQDIPSIANQILGNKTTAPQQWPGNRFDVVWVFDRKAGAYEFNQVPQSLLAGDSPDPIK